MKEKQRKKIMSQRKKMIPTSQEITRKEIRKKTKKKRIQNLMWILKMRNQERKNITA